MEKTDEPSPSSTAVRPSPARAGDAVEDVGAGEAGDERVGRRGDELVRRGELAQRPLDEHADAVGERRRLLEVVRDEQRRQPGLRQHPGELGPDRGAGVRVERRRRLVEQQHPRPAGERAGERDPLPLAAGEVARPRVGEVRDPEPLEPAK